MKKLMILAAAAAGYVLGTKAGRERYEQIRRAAKKVGNDPRVQAKAQQAADLAREKAPVVKDKLAETAGAATTKVKSATSSGTGDQLNPDSTHFQSDPYPQGDLP
jgi:alkanesulfonate monooxygenase SsuD/methylene tetrahydromethanopterin reductase-like flavin-dependent oxidoreductase (luciferase family)